MPTIALGGLIPGLTEITLTTTPQDYTVPGYMRRIFVPEAVTGLQYSFDGTTYADAPAAAGFLVWSKGSQSSDAHVLWLKLSSGGPTTARLDCRAEV